MITFTVQIADKTYPAGTPIPTSVRARVGGVFAVVEAAIPPTPATDVTLAYPDLPNGTYQGFVDVLASGVVVETLGPVAFTVAPTTVSYRSGGAFSVMVG